MTGLEALEKLNTLNYHSLSEKIECKKIIKQELKALKLICEYVGKEQILFFMRQANASKEEYELLKEIFKCNIEK